MAETLITIAAEGILKKVLSIAAGEVALAWGYEEKLTTLHGTLDLIRAKLRDAERQKGTVEAVMMWLKQLKDVVGEADDMLDEVHYEMLRREVKKRDHHWISISKVTPSLPSLKRFSFRSEIGHKIEKINKKLFEINKQANDLNIQVDQEPAGCGLSVPHSNPLESDPYLDEYKIVGRENDEQHIIQLLTQSENKEERLTIVPIVGMGGIGKTTLAKSVYNNPKTDQHFDVKAWLCVSVKVEINTLLAKIYESLAEEECKSQTRVGLIANLKKKLESKRYLLVLDDVWDEERAYWEDLRSCMLKVNSLDGSAILVTTRYIRIGTKAMSKDACALGGLSDEEGWCAFKERAFVANIQPSLLLELEEIGRDIVKKCGGLPLLVNVIGCMLRNDYDKDKWLSIKYSRVWDIEDEGNRGVQNRLKLSYDSLPDFMVKQCFAYCSIFKKDEIMKRKELIQLWMALGLVEADEKRNKEMEDVGNDLFQLLVNRSLLQDVQRDKYGYVTGCCMHDLLHDLSTSLSEHLPIMHRHSNDNQNISQTSIKKNMKCVVFKESMSMTTMQATTLHTSTCIKKNISFGQDFKCVRILIFSGYELEKIDESIEEVVHLRYLDLSKTPIRVLPKSICKLYHLQTLKLQGCFQLMQLPEDTRNLISLRVLSFRASQSYIVRNLGRLTSLRVLRVFRVSREKGCQIGELGPLIHLGGQLRIAKLENVNSKEDAVKAGLSGKKHLYKINFLWSDKKPGASTNRNDKDVLEGLQPPETLKSLTIKKFSGDDFPTWVMKMAINVEGRWTPLDKLVELTLSGCSTSDLPMLEYLPHLQDLVLEDINNLTRLRSSSVKPLSPSLKSLKLKGMKRLEKWIDASTTTNSSTMLSPVLESLYVLDCPEIVILDECHLHPLKTLHVNGCLNLVSINSMKGLTSLQHLDIDDCPGLLGIPSLRNQGHSLKTLHITACHKVTTLSCEIFDYCFYLTSLSLGPFSDNLHSFPSLQGIQNLSNHLQTLTLRGWNHWESIPEEIKLLTSLTTFVIQGFGIQELPMWFSNMTSLQFVFFDDCKVLDEETVQQGAPPGVEYIFDIDDIYAI